MNDDRFVNRGLKLRLYPTEQQKIFLDKSLGDARFFYNYLLAERIKFYEDEIAPIKDDKELKSAKYKSFKPTSRKQFKEKYPFAKECSDDCLNSAERNLNAAFNNFFNSLNKSKKVGFPKFRSKKQHRDSYKECHLKINAFDFANRRLNLAKCTPIKFRRRERLPRWYSENCLLKSITISKNAAGEYWASLLFELPNFYSKAKPIAETQSIGLDWSPANFYVSSENKTGRDYGYKPQKQTHSRKLGKLQRNLQRKQAGSANYKKARLKLAKEEQHIANSRKFWIENETLRLATNYSTIGVEDLNLQGIARFLKNAKNVNDCAYATFVTRLIQKGLEHGCLVYKVDRYFPSSQICNCCGYQNHELKLSDRIWICPNCGTVLNRDYNASCNIRDESLRMRRAEVTPMENDLDALALAKSALSIPFVEVGSEPRENSHKADSL